MIQHPQSKLLSPHIPAGSLPVLPFSQRFFLKQGYTNRMKCFVVFFSHIYLFHLLFIVDANQFHKVVKNQGIILQIQNRYSEQKVLSRSFLFERLTCLLIFLTPVATVGARISLSLSVCIHVFITRFVSKNTFPHLIVIKSAVFQN